MRSLRWADVFGRRLERHHLVDPAPPERLVDVVGSVCGIHAQIMTSAELSIAARVDGVRRADVQAELWERRRLVKTYGIRGTIHVFPAHELPMWMAALRTSPPPNERQVLDVVGIDRSQMDEMVGAIGEALRGRRLTRAELGDAVVERVGAWAGQEVFPAFGSLQPRWTPAIGVAATAGLLCFGPNQGNRVTFVSPADWIGGWREVDGPGAMAEVAKRYLAAYGPATAEEFAQWFAMRPGVAGEVVRSLGDEVEEVDVEGYRAWQLASEGSPGPRVSGSVRLLPSFDVYVVGSHPRDRLIPPKWAERGRTHRASVTFAGGREQLAGPLPVLLIDGVVSGMWDRRRKGRRLVEVGVEPFGRLSARRRKELEREAARISGFLDADVTLSVVDPRSTARSQGLELRPRSRSGPPVSGWAI